MQKSGAWHNILNYKHKLCNQRKDGELQKKLFTRQTKNGTNGTQGCSFIKGIVCNSEQAKGRDDRFAINLWLIIMVQQVINLWLAAG